MNPVYSVIVPVYNAEKYLSPCIESVLNQSSGSDFEMILVNDGSRDGSAAICDRYAAQDMRIHVIHQQNQGVSAARNAGLGAAAGQYVLFLDSDDLWDSKLLEHMDRFVANGADMIEFGSCCFIDDKITRQDVPVCISNGQTGADYVSRHDKEGVMVNVSACMVAFRRAFLLDNGLKFTSGISYGEDFYFCMQCLKQAQSVYTVPKMLYRYRMNQTSVTHAPSLKNIRDLLTVTAAIYRMFPCSLLADYYCMRIWRLESLTQEDVGQLKGLLQENRDILKQVKGWQAILARSLFGVFGWYRGAKFLRLLSDMRHFRKG